jgi:hypothetical protein
LDRNSKAVKIGKANDIQDRLSTLQTGNPNELILIHKISCKSESDGFLRERYYHNKFRHLHRNGEWFNYDEIEFSKFFKEDEHFKSKQKREPLTISTLFGEKTLFNIDFNPCCYFYPNLTAQIIDNFENASKMKVPFRTMEWPTYGKSLLLPFSMETNRVFISTKKHKENIELNSFLKTKGHTNDLSQFLL